MEMTIDEIIGHCNRTCENTEMLAVARGQTQEDITSKGYWEHYHVANYLEELKQYRAIGTVSEFRELKEKATAIKSDGFSDHLLNMGYTKGMKDGYAKAIEEFAERLRQECLNNVYHEVWLHTILKIATELKGG